MQCGVCGEEVTLDDLAAMAAPEVKLFHRGEGCPACFNDADEGEENSANEETWTCQNCDVQIVTDDLNEEEDSKLYWQGGSVVHPYGTLKYAWGRHPDATDPTDIDLSATECPGCLNNPDPENENEDEDEADDDYEDDDDLFDDELSDDENDEDEDEDETH